MVKSFLLTFLCLIYFTAIVSGFAESISNSLCSYPQGSIMCKAWNHTRVDCSWRELDCIPAIHQAQIESLDLSYNKLTVLTNGIFNPFTTLHTLNISFNNISIIGEHAFSGLDLLICLDMSHNSLQFLPMFRLNMLMTLDLSWNMLFSLQDDTVRGLNNLLKLFLNDNTISSLSNNSFAGLGKLQILDLSGNNIATTSDSPFHHLHSLHTLMLDQTYMTLSPDTFIGVNQTLQNSSLHISNMTKESPFAQLSSLRYLKLSILNCDHVNEKLFVGLEKLKHLELSVEVDSTWRCEYTINLNPLVSLTHLIYYGGEASNSQTYLWPLNSLNSSLSILEIIFPIVFSLDLNSATFDALPNWKSFVKELHIHCDFAYDIRIRGSPFWWFSQLQLLRFQSKNYLGTDAIKWDSAEQTFKGLRHLTELHLNHLGIHDDVFHLMAEMFTLDQYRFKVLDVAYNVVSGNPDINFLRSNPSLEVIDLSHNNNAAFTELGLFNIAYICGSNVSIRLFNLESVSQVYIDNGICSYLNTLKSSNTKVYVDHVGVILHLPVLQELYISRITLRVNKKLSPNVRIKILRYIDTPNLKILDLSSNQISTIDNEDALKLSNLTQLDLSDNLLTSVSFLNNLHVIQVLLLSGNQITSIRMSYLSEKPLRILDLHNNFLVCDCKMENFQKWILTDKTVYLTNHLSETSVHNYQCIEPELNKGLGITHIDFDCVEPHAMKIALSCASVLVIVIVTASVIRYRWHLQYKLFLLFNKRKYKNYLINNNDPEDDFDDEDGLPRYDAYVIYHNLDEDWVDEQLIANIGEDHEESFKLCLKNRDIRAGRLIFNELSLHIRRSRKIIVILTQSFVSDNWCYFQLNMAQHRVLEENHNVLIFITLEEIPSNRLTLLLRQLFCKSKCLKWPGDKYGQGLFWQCLRQELKRPVPRDDQVNMYRQYHV